jgi:hypothetical protein
MGRRIVKVFHVKHCTYRIVLTYKPILFTNKYIHQT